MDVQTWTYIIVGITFLIYISIAIWSKASSTNEFYIAGKGVSPLANGMATAADWMSAASFISMAGIIAFAGYDGSVYLMGWTGGYVLLALLLAPYLRKFGKFTVPDFIGERYYSNQARLVAVFCALAVSFTYVAGQMRGVGIVFSRFLEIPIESGVVVGMVIVLFMLYWWYERDNLHSSCSVLCLNFCFYGSRIFYIVPNDRNLCSSNWYGICD